MNRFLTNLSLVVLVLLIAGVAAWTVPEVRDFVKGWFHSGSDRGTEVKKEEPSKYRQVTPEELELLMLRGAGRVAKPADLRTPEEYRAEVAQSAEGRLCLAFADKVNTEKKVPIDLLGPAPNVPDTPVSPPAGERLDAEFILRDHYRILEVRPSAKGPDGAPRFLFVLKGAVNSQEFPIRTAEGKIEKGRRSMSSPEVIVEVRDGKLYGIKAQIHVW